MSKDFEGCIVKTTETKESSLNYYFRKINKHPLLTGKEELELGKRISNGDLEAKKILANSNLRLVVNIAKKYSNHGLPLIDLIQEGNIGLLIAINKYNYKLGFRFSTYAAFWIKQNIIKSISEQSHSMKIPVYIQETVSKYKKIKEQLEKKLNREVQPAYVARKMNMPINKMESYLSAFNKTISLDASVEYSNGSEVAIIEKIVDEKQETTADCEFLELKRDIHQILSALKEKEQLVINLRYELVNNSKKTLEEIGQILGVTKECVRQTELRAIKKIKENFEYKNLLMSHI